MKTNTSVVVALVTAPDRKTARQLATLILQARAAACVNMVPGIQSHYWWKGKLDQAREVLLLIKTTRALAPEVERIVHAHHPYETPEFVALPVAGGSAAYLAWVDDSVVTRQTRSRVRHQLARPNP